jgi:transcriptional regulator NrdR family protein
MKCPRCKSTQTHTYNSRKRDDGTVRRFRQCDSCQNKFRTTEVNESHMHDLQNDVKRLQGVKRRITKSIKSIDRAARRVIATAGEMEGEAG